MVGKKGSYKKKVKGKETKSTARGFNYIHPKILEDAILYRAYKNYNYVERCEATKIAKYVADFFNLTYIFCGDDTVVEQYGAKSLPQKLKGYLNFLQIDAGLTFPRTTITNDKDDNSMISLTRWTLNYRNIFTAAWDFHKPGFKYVFSEWEAKKREEIEIEKNVLADQKKVRTSRLPFSQKNIQKMMKIALLNRAKRDAEIKKKGKRKQKAEDFGTPEIELETKIEIRDVPEVRIGVDEVDETEGIQSEINEM